MLSKHANVHQSHSQNDSGDLRGVAGGDGELGCLCGKAGTSHLCDGSAHSSGCVVNGLWLPFELLLLVILWLICSITDSYIVACDLCYCLSIDDGLVLDPRLIISCALLSNAHTSQSGTKLSAGSV